MGETRIREDVSYLRPADIAEMESRRAVLEEKLRNPYIQDKGAVRSEIKRTEKIMDSHSPPELEGMALDRAAKEEAELREQILEGMPSSMEMRRNPPGAVGKNIAWHKKNRTRIRRWKNLRLALNRGTDDPDVANLERFRPMVSTLNMDNAQIPGAVFSLPSPEYMKNWDQTFAGRSAESPGPQDVAAIKKELSELRHELEEARRVGAMKRGPGRPRKEEGS